MTQFEREVEKLVEAYVTTDMSVERYLARRRALEQKYGQTAKSSHRTHRQSRTKTCPVPGLHKDVARPVPKAPADPS